jgi:hypothetical protein
MELPALWNYVINMLMRKFSLIIHEQSRVVLLMFDVEKSRQQP